VTLPANEEILLDAVKGNTMEIVAAINPKGSRAVELNVYD
jgi:hypothetical protein